MLHFFDYVYYKSCKLYTKRNPDGAGLSGLAIIAGLQTFNLMTILFLITIILERKIIVIKLLFIGLYILLLILNGIRYNKFTYAILKEKWDNEEENKKIKGQLLVLLYISGTAIMFLGLAIYIGGSELVACNIWPAGSTLQKTRSVGIRI